MTMLNRPSALILFLVVLAVVFSDGSAPARTGKPQVSPGEEIQISVLKGMEEEDPVIAWNGKQYMVVWQSNRKDFDDYNIYGSRVSPEGKVLDPQGIPISTAFSNQIFLDLAWGEGEYLVVWQDLRARQRWEIYGARIRSDGTVLDPQGIPIAVGERNHRHPQVASDGKDFLVVWMEENPGTSWDVSGVRINPEGKVLDRARLRLAKAQGDQAYPAVAWGHDHYLVVWMDGPPGAPVKIGGARVTAAGLAVDAHSLTLSRSSGGPGYPAVAWSGRQFVVVWADKQPPGINTITGVLVRSSPKGVELEELPLPRSANHHFLPSVVCRSEQCLVVWEEDQSRGRPMHGIEDIIRDVRGSFVDLSRVPVRATEVMISPKAVGNHFTKAATDGDYYLVVWKDYRTGTAASLGRLVTRAR